MAGTRIIIPGRTALPVVPDTTVDFVRGTLDQIVVRDPDGLDVLRSTLADGDGPRLRDQLVAAFPLDAAPEPEPPAPEPEPEPEVLYDLAIVGSKMCPPWSWSYDEARASGDGGYPPYRLLSAADAGIPGPPPDALQAGERIVEFSVPSTAKPHAKRYLNVPLAHQYSTFETWVYVPAAYPIVAPTNIFQFKERYRKGSGWQSDPIQWIDLLPSQMLERDTGAFQGPRPTRSGIPVFAARWDIQDWARARRAMRTATPGWHHIRATITPDALTYWIDGEWFETVTPADFRIVPRPGSYDFTWGDGNYGSNPGSTLFCCGAKVTR